MVVVLGGLLLCAAPAAAHNPPYVMEMVWDDPAAETLLWTNRGLIRGNADQGFRLLCNDALSVPSAEQVDFVVTSRGDLLFATSRGLLRSSDGGCSFSGIAPLGETPIYALQRDPSTPSRLLLVTGDEARTVRVSDDEGDTWSVRAELAADEYYEQLRFAPGDPNTVYADGLALGDAFTHFIAVSTDGGSTWERYDLPLLDTEGDATLLDVDSVDPSKVLVKAQDNTPAANDRLLLSTDGGVTFSEVLQTRVLGSGRFSLDGVRIYATSETGLWTSADMGLTFAQHPRAEYMTYAAEHDGALYACGVFDGLDAGRDGVGRAAIGSADFMPTVLFTDVVEPFDCPAGSMAADLCQSAWADWALEQGVGTGGTPAGGTGGVPAGGTGGAFAGGTGDAPAAGGMAAPATGEPSDPGMPAAADTSSGGCTCHVDGSDAPVSALWMPLVLFVLAVRRR